MSGPTLGPGFKESTPRDPCLSLGQPASLRPVQRESQSRKWQAPQERAGQWGRGGGGRRRLWGLRRGGEAAEGESGPVPGWLHGSVLCGHLEHAEQATGREQSPSQLLPRGTHPFSAHWGGRPQHPGAGDTESKGSAPAGPREPPCRPGDEDVKEEMTPTAGGGQQWPATAPEFLTEGCTSRPPLRKASPVLFLGLPPSVRGGRQTVVSQCPSPPAPASGWGVAGGGRIPAVGECSAEAAGAAQLHFPAGKVEARREQGV